MLRREYWIERIEDLWRRRSVVRIAGVRRVGKTDLAQSLPNVE
jgi:predicted AAA+ superfamily ATPase